MHLLLRRIRIEVYVVFERCVRKCQSNHQENHSNIQSTHTKNDRHLQVPYWNYVCADVPADQTGYRYSNGQPAPCSALSSNCATISALCPQTCDACGDTSSRWTKPYERKNFEISSECTSTERSKLIAADALKDDMCADMLYVLNDRVS